MALLNAEIAPVRPITNSDQAVSDSYNGLDEKFKSPSYQRRHLRGTYFN